MTRIQPRHWTQALFVEHPELFLPFLAAGRARGEQEAAALAKLFRKHGVRPGDRILDLCCGIGRIAVPLAKHGFRVVGVDLSPEFLRRARASARSKRVAGRTKFLPGDYRDIAPALARERPFDAILNTFTSMGYYGRDADRSTFAELARHTVPGGVFVLKTVNRDWIVRHFERRGWDKAGGTIVLEERAYDAGRSYMVNRWEFLRRAGTAYRSEGVFRIEHRVYSPSELKELLESAGWRVRSLAANFEGDPIDVRIPGRSEVVAVATSRR